MIRNPFSEINIVCLIFIFFSINLAVYFCYALFISTFNIGISPEDPVREYIAYPITCIIICWYLQLKLQNLNISFKARFGRLSLNYRRSLKLSCLVIIKLCFSLGIALLTLSFLSLVAPSLVQSILNYANADSQTSVPSVYYSLEIFAYIIAAPLAEEFIFRGILLHVLTNKWSVSLAIIFSSLMFGCLHFNPIGASIAGIVYSLLYIKYRSLFVPIIAHAMNNALVIIAPLFLEKIIDDFNDMPTMDTVSNLWKPGLILVLVSTPSIAYFLYRQYPSVNTLLPYCLILLTRSTTTIFKQIISSMP